MDTETLKRLNAGTVAAIPLARAAGIRLEAGPDDCLIAVAPFAGNSNPHGTVFGGSLYAAALVAGYAQTVWLIEQAGLDAAVVIRHAEADYRRPLRGDIMARVAPIDTARSVHFSDSVRHRGRGRVNMTISVASDTLPVFVLHARFAAIARG